MDNKKRWISWNENVQHDYKELHEITSEAQFASVIKTSKTVRYYGTKQSSADISAGTDTLISIENYNAILDVNTELKQITVQSGIKLKELITFIESQKWCIPCLPDINTITLGGALATGTHGTSGKLLSSYMVKCRLILEDGTLKTVSEGDELMDALRVSLGTLGAMSTITLQCEDIYTLHIKEGPERDENWLKNLNTNLQAHDFLRILWLPHTGNGYVIKGGKIEDSKVVKEKLGPKHLKNRRKVSKLLYRFTKSAPWTIYFANKILYYRFFRSEKEHKGSLYGATVTKSRGSTLELAEWAIDLEVFPKLFAELKTYINTFKNKTFIHIPMDIRFVHNDQSWLSNTYNQNITVTIGCVTRDAASADSYEAFKTVETIFLKYGGRPHWGKRFEAKDAEFEKLYPKWQEFKALRKQMDPSNKFLNGYLKSVFSE